MRKIGLSLGVLAALALFSSTAMAREHGRHGRAENAINQAGEQHDHASEEGRDHRQKARGDGERHHERMRHEDREDRREMKGGDGEGGGRMGNAERENDD